MSDLLKLSSDVIDGNVGTDDVGPLNRINFQLSEVADGVAVVEAFSHCVLFATDDGLLAFDTSGPQGGARVVEAIRGWRKEPFSCNCQPFLQCLLIFVCPPAPNRV